MMNKNSSEKHLNQSKKVFFIWPDSLVKAVLFLYELIMIGEKAIQAKKKKRFKPSCPNEECLAIQHDQTSFGLQKFCYLGTLNHCNTFCLFGRRSNMFDMKPLDIAVRGKILKITEKIFQRFLISFLCCFPIMWLAIEDIRPWKLKNGSYISCIGNQYSRSERVNVTFKNS